MVEQTVSQPPAPAVESTNHAIPRCNKFESACILLPAMNETTSIHQTIEILRQTCDADISEFLFIVSPQTSPDTMAIIRQVQQEMPDRVRIHTQTLLFLGGALREA